MIYGLSLIFLSLLAVPSLIISKKTNAKELLKKITPYQGWIGIIFCFWGVWGIISALLHIGWLTTAPIWWITFIAGSLVEAGLGFMLGYPLISNFFASKDEKNKEKLERIRQKIAPKQGKLGVLGLIVGVWMILASFLFAS